MILLNEKFYLDEKLVEVINTPLLPYEFICYGNSVIKRLPEEIAISFYSKNIDNIAAVDYAYLLSTYNFKIGRHLKDVASSIIHDKSRFLLWLNDIVIPNKLNLDLNLGNVVLEATTLASGKITILIFDKYRVPVGKIVLNEVCKSLLHKLLTY